MLHQLGRRAWRSALLGLGLFFSASAQNVSDLQQSQMLKMMFSRPRAEWVSTLRDNRVLLDASFFERVDARIRWATDNCHFDDAIRFATVGDLARRALAQEGGYLSALALAFLKIGQDELALELVEEILRGPSPNVPEARWVRALYRRSIGDFSGACEDFEQLAEQNFRVDECASQLQTIYEQQGQWEKARNWSPYQGPYNYYLDSPFAPSPGAYFEIDIVQQPDFCFSKGEDAARAGKLTLAEGFYQDAIVADPKKADCWIALAALHYRMGRLQLAKAEIGRGLGLCPSSVEGWRIRGCCYERQFDRTHAVADLHNARSSFEKVLVLQPGDPVAQMSLERLATKGR